jgi:hypothetical protein
MCVYHIQQNFHSFLSHAHSLSFTHTHSLYLIQKPFFSLTHSLCLSLYTYLIQKHFHNLSLSLSLSTLSKSIFTISLSLSLSLSLSIPYPKAFSQFLLYPPSQPGAEACYNLLFFVCHFFWSVKTPSCSNHFPWLPCTKKKNFVFLFEKEKKLLLSSDSFSVFFFLVSNYLRKCAFAFSMQKHI